MKTCPNCEYEGDDEEFEMNLSQEIRHHLDGDLYEMGGSPEGPCYQIHLSNTDYHIEYVDGATAALVLEAACLKSPSGMLSFSVTSLEKHYQEYLDAVEFYPGAKICTIARGSYECYYVTLPMQPDLDNV